MTNTTFKNPSTDPFINALLFGGDSGPTYIWGNGDGSTTNITYSFRNTTEPLSTNWVGLMTDITSFSENDKTHVRNIFNQWESLANINFTEVDETNGSVGDIRIGLSEFVNSGHVGYAAPLNLAYSSLNTIHGDIFMNSTHYDGNLIYTYNDYQAIVHEIGHVLGLKHPFEGSPRLSLADDNGKNTTMSYYGDEEFGITPMTPMLFDIAAIQYLYGANTTARSGNDTYGFVNSGQTESYAIWDTGGIDTIDFNSNMGGWGLTGTAVIDLRGDSFSYINNWKLIAIAEGVVIENVKGWSGNDIIYPNSASNHINGMSGIDTVIYSTRESLTANDDDSWTVGSDTLVNVERIDFGSIKMAIDMGSDQSGGKVAKFINAAFGSDSLSNEMYVGAGLGYFDSGMSVLELAQTCEYAGLLGSSNQTFVQNVWENVMGSEIDNTNLEHFVGLLDNQTYTKASLLALAIDLELNDNNPVLIGVQQTGLEYI